MGRTHDTLDGTLTDWIAAQHMFFVAELDRIQDSCGYAVPLLQYEGDREKLREWADRRGPDGIVEYHAEKNAESIDGLSGLAAAPERVR